MSIPKGRKRPVSKSVIKSKTKQGRTEVATGSSAVPHKEAASGVEWAADPLPPASKPSRRFGVRYCPVISKWWVYDTRHAEITVAFKLKREAVEQAMEWNAEPEVEVVHCGLTERRGEIGIHLTNPDKYEIEGALRTAARDLFPAVFCHYSNVVRLQVAS